MKKIQTREMPGTDETITWSSLTECMEHLVYILRNIITRGTAEIKIRYCMNERAPSSKSAKYLLEKITDSWKVYKYLQGKTDQER